jgi:putative Mn2+ efflux pump MntP
MKIYNKKAFISGAVSLLMPFVLLLACIIKNFDLKSAVLIFLLFFMGIYKIAESISHRLSQENKIEDMDERNRFIQLKSESKAFHIFQKICLYGSLVFINSSYNEKSHIVLYSGHLFF